MSLRHHLGVALRRIVPALVIVAGMAIPTAADAAVRIIGAAKSGDGQSLLRFIVQQSLALKPGDYLFVYDALDESEVATIAVPNVPAMRHIERKAAAIKEQVGRVREWTARMQAPAGDDPNFIHASSFLDAIAPVIAEHGEPARVMFIGGPWFSARGAFAAKSYVGSFPSDGMILGSRSESPFGTEGRRDLAGVSVDYCVMGGSGVFASPAQRERVERAWSLLVHQRGGNLESFTTDIAACEESFARAEPREGRAFAFDEADARLVRMHRIEETTPAVEVWRPADAAPSPAPTPTPAVTHTAAPSTPAAANVQRAWFEGPVRTTPPAQLAGPAWIGIQWNETVDLDLYARCSPTAPYLYYGHPSSPEGRHDFDFKGGTGQDFEVVELLQPCPDISAADVWVNFYSGTVSMRIKAVVAMKFGGGLYKAPFEMPALTGNSGHDFTPNGAMSGHNWVHIDVPALLKLPNRAAPRIN